MPSKVSKTTGRQNASEAQAKAAQPRTIVGTSLTSYEVAADGSCFRLNVKDDDGRAGALILPAECIRQLLMTIPRIATQTIRGQSQDSSLRLVYPLRDWKLEAAAGDDRVILTMCTGEGFEVSFAVEAPDMRRMSAAVGGLDDADEAGHPRLN
jgi:hypothetical protein